MRRVFHTAILVPGMTVSAMLSPDTPANLLRSAGDPRTRSCPFSSSPRPSAFVATLRLLVGASTDFSRAPEEAFRRRWKMVSSETPPDTRSSSRAPCSFQPLAAPPYPTVTGLSSLVPRCGKYITSKACLCWTIPCGRLPTESLCGEPTYVCARRDAALI